MIERDKEYYNHKISELYSVIENQEKIIRELQNQLKQANECKEEQKRRKELIQKKRDMYKAKLNKAEKRIDKAIEYIENDKYEYTPMGITNKPINKELLEILKGGNNE